MEQDFKTWWKKEENRPVRKIILTGIRAERRAKSKNWFFRKALKRFENGFRSQTFIQNMLKYSDKEIYENLIFNIATTNVFLLEMELLSLMRLNRIDVVYINNLVKTYNKKEKMYTWIGPPSDKQLLYVIKATNKYLEQICKTVVDKREIKDSHSLNLIKLLKSNKAEVKKIRNRMIKNQDDKHARIKAIVKELGFNI